MAPTPPPPRPRPPPSLSSGSDDDDDAGRGGSAAAGSRAVAGQKRTRKDNRYRFESFNEKIKRVKVQVGHRIIKNYSDAPESGDSFYAESIALWRDLNCTAEFTEFLSKTRRLSNSLEQILYHKKRIFNALSEGLQRPNTPALEPLL
ncbi:hypothetical protein HK405_008126, partial [Cladochytrium tenue]